MIELSNMYEIIFNTADWTPIQIEALKQATNGLATIQTRTDGSVAVGSDKLFPKIFRRMSVLLNSTGLKPGLRVEI